MIRELPDVLCLSHLRWSFVYQRPNHLMARWARDRRVFFVEEPHFDAESPRLHVDVVSPRIHVVTPHLPGGLDPARAELLQRELVSRLVEQEQIEQPILWFYTPVALAWAGHVPARVTVYDCMDELSHFLGAPATLAAREKELFAAADLVFTGGQSLYEAKRAEHPRVHAFPSSVDLEHFRAARHAPSDPPDQAPLRRPRVGFFGVIDERMDLDLLARTAELCPELEFVLLGPVVKIEPASLPRLPNVHWLGPKRYEELPRYIAGWNVAMMPFARNDATKFISPTKTLEYLAAGKPVVSTSIRDVVRPYGEEGLARIADSPQDFAAAVRAALADPLENPQRERLLARTSWDATFEQMRRLVETAQLGKTEHNEGGGSIACTTISS